MDRANRSSASRLDGKLHLSLSVGKICCAGLAGLTVLPERESV
jgi:hypothetical protein